VTRGERALAIPSESPKVHPARLVFSARPTLPVFARRVFPRVSRQYSALKKSLVEA
jgi:hypothetical protein